jgi:hypothetical protein
MLQGMSHLSPEVAAQTPDRRREFEARTHLEMVSQRPDTVPTLVAKVYAEAPAALRSRLLEHLLKPLGLLSLITVANGVFARLPLSSGWGHLRVSAEQARQIGPREVAALAAHVQQISGQAIEGLAQLLASSPILASSTAAAMLVTLISRQHKAHSQARGNDFDPL